MNLTCISFIYNFLMKIPIKDLMISNDSKTKEKSLNMFH